MKGGKVDANHNENKFNFVPNMLENLRKFVTGFMLENLRKYVTGFVTDGF